MFVLIFIYNFLFTMFKKINLFFYCILIYIFLKNKNFKIIDRNLIESLEK